MSRLTSKCLSDFLNNDKEINTELKAKIIRRAAEIKGDTKFKDMLQDQTDFDATDIDIIKEAARELIKDGVMQKRSINIQVTKMKELSERIETSYNKILEQAKRTGHNVSEAEARKMAYKSIFIKLPAGRATGITPIEISKEATRGELLSMISGIVEDFGKLLNSVKGDAMNKKFLDEVMGIDTGDAAVKKMGDEFKELLQYIKKEYSKNGLYIPELDNYFYQKHDISKMTQMGKEEWIQDVINDLNWEKTRRTDGTKIPVEGREEFLSYAYDTLTTNGMNKRQEVEIDDNGKITGYRTNETLQDTLSFKRILHFKDADTTHAYNQKYGYTDYLNVVIESIQEDVMRLNLARQMGPDPDKTFSYIIKKYQNEKMEINSGEIRSLETYYTLQNTDRTDLGNPMISSIGGILRRIAILPKVGSIILASIPDLVSHAMNRVESFKNIPAIAKLPVGVYFLGKHVAKNSWNMIKNLNPNGSREHYIRSLGVVEHTLWRHGKFTNIMDSDANPMITFNKNESNLKKGFKKGVAAIDYGSKKLMNSLYKFSLMNDFASTQKAVATQEILNDFVEYRNIKYEDLNPAILQKFDDMGFEKKHFDALKHFDVEDVEGISLMTLRSMKNYDKTKLSQSEADEVYGKFWAFVEQYRRLSYLETSDYVRAMTQLGTDQVGSVGYQLSKTVFQFKSFPIQFFLERLRPMAVSQTWMKGIYDVSVYSLLSIPLGYATIQMQQLANGNTTIKQNDKIDALFWETLARSWTAGGGASFISDIALGDFSGSRDIKDYLFGPTFEMVSDLGELFSLYATRDIRQAMSIEKVRNPENSSKSGYIKAINAATPFADLWYLKPMKKLLLEQYLNEKMNDKYAKEMREKNKRLKKRNQENYLKEAYDDLK